MTTPAPTGPPAVGRRGLAVRAALAGKAAALAGEPVEVCPYAASRPFSRRAWLLGYTAGRDELDAPPTGAADDLDAPWPGDED